MQARAVLFDLDGTLRYSVPSWSDTLNDYIAGLGLVADTPENRLRAIRWDYAYWAQSDDLLADLQAFEDDERGLWVNFYRRRILAFGLDEATAAARAADLDRHMQTNFNPRDHVPEDVRPALASLREAGCVVGLVSNRSSSIDGLMETLGLAGYFEFTLISGEVGAWKPDPAIFAHALDRAGTIPAETVYVGDNYYADVVGARLAGLQPVLIDPRGLFPDAGCPVITTIGEVPSLVGLV
ncbi:MAG: HAD family hydrolase [Anaerolineales bacterium]|nr:HAD family hydrolase [Anaerolineales bacterium]